MAPRCVAFPRSSSGFCFPASQRALFYLAFSVDVFWVSLFFDTFAPGLDFAFLHRSVHSFIFCLLLSAFTSFGFLFFRYLRALVRSVLAAAFSSRLRVCTTREVSKPHYEVWGRFIASFSLFRMAAPSTPLFDFWDDVVVILYLRVVCIYDFSGWANVMISRTGSYKAVQCVPV